MNAIHSVVFAIRVDRRFICGPNSCVFAVSTPQLPSRDREGAVEPPSPLTVK